MSVHSRRLVITRRARSDLRDIRSASERFWGPQQRALYEGRLCRGFLDLVAFPEMGRPRPELGDQVRSFLLGEHVVYYQVRTDQVRILRLRHVGRDEKDLMLA